MKTVTPNYYDKFKCIADKCKHSCCIGWEIDIDGNTAAIYKNMSGAIGEKLHNNIDFNSEPPHFILKENDRCPFLLENGLCELIINLGEDKLCDICALHPRFKNYLTNKVEIGLGLSCEEACRIILSEKEKFTLKNTDDETLEENELEIISLRNEVMEILQRREISIYERLSLMLKLFERDNKPLIEDFIGIFTELESLDEAWQKLLYKLKSNIENLDIQSVLNEYPLEFENLAVYFIYRHLIKAVDDFCEKEYLQFAYLSVYMIAGVLAAVKREKGTINREALLETARMYSSEIEYSDENTEALIDALCGFNERNL